MSVFNSAEIKIGHAANHEAHTGCTVFLLPEGSIASADFRGPAPGSREAALLLPTKPLTDVNAFMLTGGSAFGLATADGAMRWHADNDIGHVTPIRKIPIVGTAVVYDLFFNMGQSLPDAEMGYAACENAVVNNTMQGNVGAGAGVTVGKWGGFPGFMKGGFGVASHQVGELVVFAAIAVNAIGDVVAEDGSVLAGALDENGEFRVKQNPYRLFGGNSPTNITNTSPANIMNTSLAVIGTNARLDKVGCHRLAQRAHDGMAMAIRPIHTTHDGDSAFAAATQKVDAPFDWVANIGAELVAQATRNAVRNAHTVGQVPGLAGDANAG